MDFGYVMVMHNLGGKIAVERIINAGGNIEANVDAKAAHFMEELWKSKGESDHIRLVYNNGINHWSRLRLVRVNQRLCDL